MYQCPPLLRIGLIVLCSLLCAPMMASYAAENAEKPETTDPVDVAATAWRIVGYTRWPQEPAPLQVCIAGDSANAEALRYVASFMMQKRAVAVHDWSAEKNAVEVCNVMYVGQMPVDERVELIKSLINHPVLTIGEHPEFCSNGGMFCFDLSRDGLRFEVNLDAIERSKLRINPQVLRLAYPPKKSGP